MLNAEKKLKEIKKFALNYIKWSQERGKMYGSVAEIESNWVVLDNIFFILRDLHEEMNDYNFSAFLRTKGFGAKRASSVIAEMELDDPFLELNNLWNEYLEWRTELLSRNGK